MPPQIALYIYLLFILWLFTRDRKLRPMTSSALWIPLLWIIIIGSRPFSAWFGGGILVDSPDDYLDGSPVDRMFFLILIILGLMVVLKRRVNWRVVFSSNRWLFAFFLYCLISVIWSDYPFVGFKRWIKDVGNVLMVLVILSEKDPVQAIKAVFTRYTNLAIPLSVLFIKYFPNIGRYYNRWTWEPSYGGVTLEKNALGAITFICGMFLVWDLLQLHHAGNIRERKMDLLGRALLVIMVIWLMVMVNSSTSLVCLILGTGILIVIRSPLVRQQVRYLGTYILLLSVMMLLINFVPGVMEMLVEALGRDMTLTGRTDLWSDVLREPIDPLLGTGYQSFWLGTRAEHMWEKYYFHPNQAHNGYIETYLNGGLVGVFLLFAMIISGGSSLKKELLHGSEYWMLRFSFLIVVPFYNWTEAMFNKLSLVWVIMLIALLQYPRLQKSVFESIELNAKNDTHRTLSKEQCNTNVLTRFVSFPRVKST